METNRKIGDDILISKIGFGTWALGGSSIYSYITESDAVKALEYYCSEGGNFIDSAQGYFDSELVIGKFLELNPSYKNKAIIATKTNAGNTLETLHEIEEKLDVSLKRLGKDYVDLYYLHNPSENDEVIAASMEVLQGLKKKGKIRATAASIKGPDVTSETGVICKKYIDTKKIDVIQLVYSILRQQNDEIFDYAKDNNVALICRTSLESGFLTGNYKKGHRFEKLDQRGRWNNTYDEIADYIEDIRKKFIGVYDDNLTSLAVRFAMHPDAITDVIVGSKNKYQMADIIKYVNKEPLCSQAIKELKDMFKDKTSIFNIER